MHLCLLPHVASPRCLHPHVPPPSRPSPRLPGPPGPPRRQHCNQATTTNFSGNFGSIILSSDSIGPKLENES